MKSTRVSFTLVILLFTTFIFASLVPIGQAQKTAADKLTYSWSEETYSFSFFKEWVAQAFTMNESGTYSANYNFTVSNSDADYRTEEYREVRYESAYDYEFETTLTGNMSTSFTVDVYQVDVSYGQDVALSWIAIKNGTFQTEYYIDQLDISYTIANQYNKTVDIDYTKYDIDTSTVVDEWTDQVIETADWQDSWVDSLEQTRYGIHTSKVSVPLVLIYQIFKKGANTVAWAEMFCDYYIYNDTDKNGIYSVGESSSAPPSGAFGMYTSDEFRGFMIPQVIDGYSYFQNNYSDPGTITEMEMWQKFPHDREVSDFSDDIEFTAPTLLGDVVSWDINYPDFPVTAIAFSDHGSFSSGMNMTYANTAPMNFSYGFEYQANEAEAHLDVTTDLSELSDSTFFDVVQGLSLAIPHYSFILSTSEITEVTNTIITAPTNIFDYQMDNETVMGISMEAVKSEYTLKDYPVVGEEELFTSIGSTVSKLIVNAIDTNPIAPKNGLIDMIFSLKDLDIVKNNPELNLELYNIQMQNYPTWSGRHMINDPRFSIYYGELSPPTTEGPSVPFLHIAFIGMVALITAGLVLFYKRRMK